MNSRIATLTGISLRVQKMSAPLRALSGWFKNDLSECEHRELLKESLGCVIYSGLS